MRNVPDDYSQYEQAQFEAAQRDAELSSLTDSIALEIEEDGSYSEELLAFFQEDVPANWTKDKIVNELAYKLAKERLAA